MDEDYVLDNMQAENPVERTGVSYAIKLAYTRVDESNSLSKRDLLYSLLCFGCMFDDCFSADPDPIVRKYGCLNAPEPLKLDLYDLVYQLVTLENADDELRIMWYMTFAYVIMSEAPHNDEVYEKLCAILHRNDVFEGVLRSRYSIFIPPTAEELEAQGASTRLIDWYTPYLRYCQERDEKGVTRETAECKRLLALGNFNEALIRSERLLASFPDDLQVAISNIAARVSLSSASDKYSRDALLKDTLSLIDDYIDVAPTPYFRYYRGLTLLGLLDTAGARREFTLCLQQDPSFELASLMIKGMDKYEG